jgi:hypothetical protein
LHGLALETSIWNWQDQPDIAGTRHSRGFRRNHYEGIRPVFSAGVCLRHASTSLRYRVTSEAHSFHPDDSCQESRYCSVFHFSEATLVASFVVTSRYVRRRVTRYLLSKQWVSLTRESALKSPLTASIQAEFNSRAVISVYQQSSVVRPQNCRHREDSMIPTYSPYVSMIMMF